MATKMASCAPFSPATPHEEAKALNNASGALIPFASHDLNMDAGCRFFKTRVPPGPQTRDRVEEIDAPRHSFEDVLRACTHANQALPREPERPDASQPAAGEAKDQIRDTWLTAVMVLHTSASQPLR